MNTSIKKSSSRREKHNNLKQGGFKSHNFVLCFTVVYMFLVTFFKRKRVLKENINKKHWINNFILYSIRKTSLKQNKWRIYYFVLNFPFFFILLLPPVRLPALNVAHMWTRNMQELPPAHPYLEGWGKWMRNDWEKVRDSKKG